MISVVLPVRDGLPWLDAQLSALVAQQCDEPWEIVVADNGSTDTSVDLAHSWAERCSRMQVVDVSARPGPAAARNAGVRAAQGDMVAFCDADDIVQPGWIRAFVTALAEADVVAGVFDMASLNGAPARAPAPAATNQLGFLPAGLAANLAVRRPAFEAVGGFSEDLLVGEDIDLCWRLQLGGFRFSGAPGAVVAKREAGDLGSHFHRAVAYGRSGPTLYHRYRGRGARRDLLGAAKSWGWLVVSILGLGNGVVRRKWVRAAGMRLGRLAGSLSERVFFP